MFDKIFKKKIHAKVDLIVVNGKEYAALYCGEQNLTGLLDGYISREFWRLENAYDDLKNISKTGNVLPYDNYPVQINTGQVFVMDMKRTNGSVERTYYRSDGHIWKETYPYSRDLPVTEEFKVG